MYKKQRLELGCNHLIINKVYFKDIISSLALSKATKKKIEARTANREGKMAKPLTNVILASILHLIWRDLVENRRVRPRRAPPCWVPPRRAPARR
jgi:hypothetical protein